MTYPTKCTLAMVLGTALAGCIRTETKERYTEVRMGGSDTNINASLAAIAIAFNRELLTQSNHWFHASAFIRTMDERLKALEAQLAPGMRTTPMGPSTPPVPVPTPGAVPPLHSAPVIPGIEKGTP